MNRSYLLLSCLLSFALNAETVVWDVEDLYGLTGRGIREAIADATSHFSKHPNDELILELAEGSNFLEMPGDSKGTIDLSNLRPGKSGRLIFRGKGMKLTTLVFSDDKHAIYGRDVYRVSFQGMHMTRKKYTVSQGHVLEVSPQKVLLEIQEGFPTPHDIFNPDSGQGRYLRRYTPGKTNPQLILEGNNQVPWVKAEHKGGRIWEMQLKRHNEIAPYSKGDLVGIKSKHGGQTYWFMGGSDIEFKDVKWTHKTRGVFRGGIGNIRFINCVTDRAAPINGQTPCLASPGGGPQIGQPNDPATSGNLVENCRFYASGDDAVAFFNGSGIIRNCQITDAFARGILLSNSPDVRIVNTTLLRCPIQRTSNYQLQPETWLLPEGSYTDRE